jgi:predicted Ser/Thr protein kinase
LSYIEAIIPESRISVSDECIGTGSSAKVYTGTYFNTPVAIKVINTPIDVQNMDDEEVLLLVWVSLQSS